MKKILDACCGSRMFWFDRENPNVIFADNREIKTTLCDGFDECMRVLEPDGVLVFKWNEDQIKLNDVLKEFVKKPLLGDQRGKTRWILFMK